MYCCNVCGLEYQDKQLAGSCETSKTPDQPCKPGDEVKLLNTRSRTWTLAKCKEVIVVPTKLSKIMTDGTFDEYAEAVHVDLSKNRHEWLLILEKEVFLDTTWGEFKTEVSASYILKEDKIKYLQRADNAG